MWLCFISAEPSKLSHAKICYQITSKQFEMIENGQISFGIFLSPWTDFLPWKRNFGKPVPKPVFCLPRRLRLNGRFRSDNVVHTLIVILEHKQTHFPQTSVQSFCKFIFWGMLFWLFLVKNVWRVLRLKRRKIGCRIDQAFGVAFEQAFHLYFCFYFYLTLSLYQRFCLSHLVSFYLTLRFYILSSCWLVSPRFVLPILVHL